MCWHQVLHPVLLLRQHSPGIHRLHPLQRFAPALENLLRWCDGMLYCYLWNKEPQARGGTGGYLRPDAQAMYKYIICRNDTA